MSVAAVVITIALGTSTAVHHGSPVSAGAVIAIGVGVATIAGFGLSALAYWITQRRVRPIVICHEQRKRHIREEAATAYWAASVYLKNVSTTSAFNVRFGIDMDGRYAAWKHHRGDEKASRLNVLIPNERHPEGNGLMDVFIDERMLWDISDALGGEGDVDDGRIYWAYYQGPAGDWWYTSNPSDRTDDFTIKRVRSRRVGAVSRGNRKLVKSIERGAAIRAKAISDLNAANDEMRRRREQGQDLSPDEPTAEL